MCSTRWALSFARSLADNREMPSPALQSETLDAAARLTGIQRPFRRALLVAVTLVTAVSAAEASGSPRRRAVGRELPPPPAIERVSVASDGTEWTENCEAASISADGRFVVFDCVSTTLPWVGSPPTPQGDVWLYDRQTRQTTRVSEGAPGPRSSHPSVSADGRVIVFMSGDRAGRDIFVRDRVAATLTRVLAGRIQPIPRVSGDGRTVVFATYDGSIVLMAYELATGRITSLANRGRNPSVDGEGRFIAFESLEIVDARDTNGVVDVVTLDLVSRQIKRVSASPEGGAANGASFRPAISANGRFVVYESDAHNLVAGDTNGVRDIFVHDGLTGETTRVSVASNGAQANGNSFLASVSAGGRYVVFGSQASNLVIGDMNQKSDIFVHDRQTGRTTRISQSADGVEGDGDSSLWDTIDFSPVGPALSADGRFVAFSSYATNLVPHDRNRASDVFVAATGFESDAEK